MSGTIGLVAFSFALREHEPNPCNIRLAKAVMGIVAEKPTVAIVAQWEVARQLERDHYSVALTVEPPSDGSYLDSEGVWEAAKVLFEQAGVTQVIPVAQPFLQMAKVKQMIRRDGYEVVSRRMGWIGFDSKSKQPWTRSPLRLLAYAIKQKLTGSRGFGGRQST